MNWKRYRHYRIDFNGFWLQVYCILCGLSFFLRTVYYFMFTNPADVSVGRILFSMILPLLSMGAILVILKFLRLDKPDLLGIMGAVLSLLLLIASFFTGDVLRILLSLVIYGGGGALLLGTVCGYVPTRQFAMILFGVASAARVLFYAPGLDLLAWIIEASELCTVLSLLILPAIMRPLRKR